MTHKQILYKAMRRGEKIDPRRAWLHYGIYRLAARIHELRTDGIPIITTRRETRTGAKIAIYSMRRKAA
jgi:hypothetical protein